MGTDLYRLRNDGGALLYVGISGTLLARMAQHAGAKPWWQDVARVDVQHFETQAEAAAAEAVAIVSERPLHNVAMAVRAEGGWGRLRRARETQGCTLVALARSAEMSLGYLSDLESGKREPNPSITRRLAVALNVPLSVLEKDRRIEDAA